MNCVTLVPKTMLTEEVCKKLLAYTYVSELCLVPYSSSHGTVEIKRYGRSISCTIKGGYIPGEEIESMMLSVASMQSLKSFHLCGGLNVYENDYFSRIFEALADNPGVEYTNVNKCVVNDRLFESILLNTQLKELYLSSNTTTLTPDSQLRLHTNLGTLCITNDTLTFDGADCIVRSATSVSTLKLDMNQIKNDGKEFPGNSSITYLGVSHNFIDVHGINSLHAWESLVTLDASFNDFQPHQTTKFTFSTNLANLAICNKLVTAPKLADVISGNHSLRLLELHDFEFDARDASEMQLNTTLTRLQPSPDEVIYGDNKDNILSIYNRVRVNRESMIQCRSLFCHALYLMFNKKKKLQPMKNRWLNSLPK